jgi:glycosyltransferase involved in cell wall biosynthesis
MIVLHLIESLGIGGAERRLLNDLKYLDRKKIVSIVCSVYGNNDLAAEVKNLGIPLYCLNLQGVYDFARAILDLRKIIRRHRVDILHTQLFTADLFGRIVKKFFNVSRLVSTIQSSVYEPNEPYLYSFKRRIIDSISGRISNDAFIAVSHFVKNSVAKRLQFPEDKIRVIYNSVDFDKFDGVDIDRIKGLKKELGISDNSKVLIVIGRLDPPKGHHFLLSALPKIKEKFPSIKLLIVGDGFCRDKLESCSNKLKLTDYVIFTGTRKDVKELLYLSDIFVFPTLSEGLPLTLLEAMAVKKPCIASNIGPIREIIEDEESGLLVEPGSAEALARSVLNILNRPMLMSQIAKNGYEVANNKFNAKKLAEQLESFYEELL